ncbi:MAG: orotidine 5'-phosphate decarboxylase, partial [Bacteroidota bacterium]
AGPDQLMFVAGATQADHFVDIRQAAGEHFLLVPGVGAQGGDLAAISKAGFSSKVGLLVNSSRGIIYAGKGTNFAEGARAAAATLQQQMDKLLQEAGF